MTCAVIDDDIIAQKALVEVLKNIPDIKVMGAFTDPIKAHAFLLTNTCDFIFLDIEMPHLTGVELTKIINKQIHVVFTTSRKDYAVEAFDLNVVDYIVKPISTERVLKAISKVKMHAEKVKQPSNTEFIFVKNNGVLEKIIIDDIQYIQAYGDYVHLYLTGKKITLHQTLSKIESKLPANLFFKPHRSYLVAINKITKVEDNTLYIQKQPIPIAEQSKSKLLILLNSI